jgi:flagellar motility protein MotE (MotC chaperone)
LTIISSTFFLLPTTTAISNMISRSASILTRRIAVQARNQWKVPNKLPSGGRQLLASRFQSSTANVSNAISKEALPIMETNPNMWRSCHHPHLHHYSYGRNLAFLGAGAFGGYMISESKQRHRIKDREAKNLEQRIKALETKEGEPQK